MEQSLETIYDTYSAMLFNLAVQNSATEKEAEEIVISTFSKFHAQGMVKQNSPSHCVTLIKLLAQTALEHLKPGEEERGFKIKQLENSPLLHKLLCEQADINSHCTENNMTREEAGKKIREELIAFRKVPGVLA